MFDNQANGLADLLQAPMKPDGNALAASSDALRQRCESCAGTEVTVVFGGSHHRPQIRLPLALLSTLGRGPSRHGAEGGSNPTQLFPRANGGAAEPPVFSGPKITFVCGGCGAYLMTLGGRIFE